MSPETKNGYLHHALPELSPDEVTKLLQKDHADSKPVNTKDKKDKTKLVKK